jgi:hypothetical protein
MAALDALQHGDAFRDTAQRGCVSDAGTYRIGGDATRTQLHGELTDVGLEGRLGRGDSAVALDHAR